MVRTAAKNTCTEIAIVVVIKLMRGVIRLATSKQILETMLKHLQQSQHTSQRAQQKLKKSVHVEIPIECLHDSALPCVPHTRSESTKRMHSRSDSVRCFLKQSALVMFRILWNAPISPKANMPEALALTASPP